MKAVKSWLLALLAFATLLAMFAAAVGGQVGLAYFIKAGGGSMIPPMAGLISAGLLYRDHKAARPHAMFIAIALVAMINMRGFYWAPFGRQHGFFTPNRISAHAIFAACLFGPALWSAFKARRNRPK